MKGGGGTFQAGRDGMTVKGNSIWERKIGSLSQSGEDFFGQGSFRASKWKGLLKKKKRAWNPQGMQRKIFLGGGQ